MNTEVNRSNIIEILCLKYYVLLVIIDLLIITLVMYIFINFIRSKKRQKIKKYMYCAGFNFEVEPYQAVFRKGDTVIPEDVLYSFSLKEIREKFPAPGINNWYPGGR